uniref:GRIP and coiledcoil domaincontaining protein 1like [Strongylocentrotus purpuratus] n=1 Tax=Lepeophtheirus salmonis TaxID=72036 RepID=A0A0K2UR32_LEPSM
MNRLGKAERKDRNQLIVSIQEKDECIKNFQEKLSFLNENFKSVSKQKKALEEVVRVLQSSQNGAGEVAALSTSLKTLMDEKNSREKELKENIKKLCNDLEGARSQNQRLKNDLTAKDVEANRKLEEMKSKLIVEQHERHQELQDHTSTLKELQKRLFEERSEKAKFEKEIMSIKDTTKHSKSKIDSKSQEIETLVNEERGSSVKDCKTVSADEIDRLRKEINQMEVFHRQQLEKAELRATKAERISLETQEIQESRVMNLELRLEELSDTVATYDRQRQDDQISISNLRERISQLDTDNVALNHVRQVPEESLEEEEGLHSIVEKIMRLKSQLRERNSKSENPIHHIDSYLCEEKKDDNSEFEEWKSKYMALSEDFDAFKKQNSSLNNDSHSYKGLMDKIQGGQEEIISLKNQVKELKERVTRLRAQISSFEEGKIINENKIRELNIEFNHLKLSMSETLQSREVENRNKTLTLESELVKQRERFVSSMKEKEDELKIMRDNLEMAIDNGFVNYMNRKSSVSFNGSTNIDQITDKLNMSTDDESKMILHYSEESARKEKQIYRLQCQIRDLETAMRELQARFINKEEDYVMEIENLEEKVSVLQRMAKSDFNVEYLKNVVVNYMLSTDLSSKEHMLNAIGAVLVFSDKEIRKIKAFHNSWFWRKS